jgi:hypothetical protein
MNAMAQADGIVGSGGYTYRVVADWAKLPPGWTFKDVAAVAVDSQDRVYVFNRGEHPMIVFDRDGNMLNSWGEGPFNRCTHTALSPDLDIYVSDGYANARVHKFAPNGKLLFSWGECGAGPGEFNILHNIVSDPDGWVYVADRENHRVQIFDGNGRYETQWNNLHRPCGLYMEGGAHGVCYIGELGPHQPVNQKFPNLGPRLSIVSGRGEVVSRVDEKSGLPVGQFTAPHGLCVDRHGDIYVGEVSWTAWQNYTNPGQPVPASVRSLQKLVRAPR